jgi:hypothetical protein
MFELVGVAVARRLVEAASKRLAFQLEGVELEGILVEGH